MEHEVREFEKRLVRCCDANAVDGGSEWLEELERLEDGWDYPALAES